MKDCKITSLEIRDIRFPTSDNLDGSDAMNPDPDYSAAYVILKTDHPRKLRRTRAHFYNWSWERNLC